MSAVMHVICLRPGALGPKLVRPIILGVASGTTQRVDALYRQVKHKNKINAIDNTIQG